MTDVPASPNAVDEPIGPHNRTLRESVKFSAVLDVQVIEMIKLQVR